ncbi:MAG: hypothetical protein QM809_09660 [Gordonia sp. (in: high G+C Gram-positive bacteria)]|uniref:hypothetical protein n=1 Tax=Gordonia sp. (in: high G+C Gram-positive bacteria) TaxID=84139 RepID=UPI0039E3AA91
MPRSLLLRRLAATVLLLAAAAAVLLTGYASAVSPPAGPDRTAAAAALPVPADFEDRLGYRPVVEDGRRVNPSGSCSSPIPLPSSFEPACRAHDYGYDLLRYAAATGTTPPPGTRAELDSALVTDMHRRCADPLCHLAAEAARAGLAVNTWRQRGGAPEPESGLQIASSLVSRIARTVAERA